MTRSWAFCPNKPPCPHPGLLHDIDEPGGREMCCVEGCCCRGTVTSTEIDLSCCALEDGHDGPCAWLCSSCSGSNRCFACGGTGGLDDVQRCTECDAGHCPYCNEGLVSDEY
jgi:hypothetical protein